MFVREVGRLDGSMAKAWVSCLDWGERLSKSLYERMDERMGERSC